MGLFDKKTCDLCGGKIGMLGNKKLSDGNMCKECAKKLSPWFTDRKKSTVSEIKAQLEYREQNQNAVNAFTITRQIGGFMKLLIDDNNRKWTVGTGSEPLSDNPDILDFSQAGGCDLEIDEHRREKFQNIDGESVSYNPPRYDFSYDFDANIRVLNNPYFDYIPFSISNGYVNTGEQNMNSGMATSGWTVNSNSFLNSFETKEYYDCINIGNELKAAFDGMQQMSNAGNMNQGMNQAPMGNMNQGMNQAPMGNMNQAPMGNQPAENTQGPKFCSSCGAPLNGGKFCSNCGAPN
ncbi:MAG: DUF4428 domain-containing protein [Lachnospiraceae bacterium]|nr:DUF4428 domain-containing protein [Lachnospiraceae bacterium]